MNLYEITQSVDFIKNKIAFEPKIGIVLGSGLNHMAEEIKDAVYIDYKEIPYFVASTAPGHKGRFVVGTLEGKAVICMQGRLHYYEGHTMKDVTYPIRVMKMLGIKNLLLTNASGGINRSFNVGDLMLIDDHINFLGTNPLIGKNIEEFGPRFCDMTYAYTPELKEIAFEASAETGIELKRGTYIATTGPSFETPAEIRMYRTLGADAVGMSTVPEVIVASHAKLNVLAISLITNMAAGILDQPLTEEEVLEIGSLKGKDLQRLVRSIIKKLT
jgi:purine-nucleoside phosphorylase